MNSPPYKKNVNTFQALKILYVHTISFNTSNSNCMVRTNFLIIKEKLMKIQVFVSPRQPNNSHLYWQKYQVST